MSIIRTNKTEKYFVASNELFNDKLISWDARGLMAYLLSKPNHWQVRIDDLLSQSPAGITKLRSILTELEENGYIKRTRIKKEDGTFDWITDIYESSIGRFSADGKHDDIVSTELVSTDNNMAAEEKPPSLPQSLSDEMLDKLPIEWQIKAGKEKIVMPDEKEMEILDRADLIAMGTGINHPIYKGIAYAFMKERGIIIPESKVKGQRKAVREMVEQGVLPNHAQMATRKLMEAGMTVVDLFAISKTAVDLANPVNGPDFSQPQESRFESMDDLGD